MTPQVVEGPREIVIPFEVKLDNETQPFRDALHMTEKEYASSTAPSRKAIMIERARAWAHAIANPAPEKPEPPHEARKRLRQERADLFRQQALIEDQLAEAEDDPEA